MLKKISIILFVSLLIIGIYGSAFATDTYTATSTINGITVNWTYKLNDASQIIDLQCENILDLNGNISIPRELDGKLVVGIGDNAFNGAKNIIEVAIPDSVKSIDYKAFANCTNLSKIDLGSITSINFKVFEGCTNLKEITIPKTLKEGSVEPCLSNSNITKIIFEDGLTVIPSCLCANTGITEVIIPNSVKNIEYNSFENCKLLKKITILDNVEEMGNYDIVNYDSIFKNHDDDLTIYCYKDSLAAKYAIKYNIKYIYLEKNTEKTLESISISKMPNKVKYTEGEKFNSAGMRITAHYTDGTTKDVTSNCTYKPTGELSENQAIITIKYVEEKIEKTADLKIEIVKSGGNDIKPTGDDKPKDDSVAPNNLPYTGGTFAIIAGSILVIIAGAYIYKRKNDFKGI